MNQRLSRPGGSGAATELGACSELWFKASSERQSDKGWHAHSVALELVEEHRHQLGIELGARQPTQLGGDALVRLRRLIWPAVDHRLVGVGDGDDARTQRDLFGFQAVGVAGAVEALVVVADDRRKAS